MPFPWPAKKEHVSGAKIEMPDLPCMGAEDETGETGEIETLTEHLGRLGQLLDQRAQGRLEQFVAQRRRRRGSRPGGRCRDQLLQLLAKAVNTIGQ